MTIYVHRQIVRQSSASRKDRDRDSRQEDEKERGMGLMIITIIIVSGSLIIRQTSLTPASTPQTHRRSGNRKRRSNESHSVKYRPHFLPFSSPDMVTYELRSPPDRRPGRVRRTPTKVPSDETVDRSWDWYASTRHPSSGGSIIAIPVHCLSLPPLSSPAFDLFRRLLISAYCFIDQLPSSARSSADPFLVSANIRTGG